MKTVKTYFALHEAYLDKALLEDFGILSFVQNELANTIKPDGFTPQVQLQVNGKDIELAIEILKTHSTS